MSTRFIDVSPMDDDKKMTATNLNYTNLDDIEINKYNGKGKYRWGNVRTRDMIANVCATTGTQNSEGYSDRYEFEDAFRFDINGINKTTNILSPFLRYSLMFDESAVEELAVGSSNANSTYGPVTANIYDMPVTPSMFNPYFAVHVCGMTDNVPLLNTNNTYTKNIKLHGQQGGGNGSSGDTFEQSEILLKTAEINDTSDCSIKKLVELSHTAAGRSELGGAGYRYADFMYCKDLGKIPNNYLITLRRFSHPVTDNIFSKNFTESKDDTSNGPSEIVAPDTCRLVTWFNEDNKLEDIIKYSFHSTFKEFNAAIQQLSSQEDAPERGIMGSIVNLANPAYRKAVGAGYAGSGNKILGKISSMTKGVLNNNGTYENHPCLGNYDNNRIYTPRNTVQDTHLYEGKLEFQHEFTLVFNYEMKGYRNINPKSAMLDLLANITEVTYNHGHFWGGEQKIVGAPSNRSGWKTAQNFLDQKWEELGAFFDGIMGGGMDWNSIWGAISNAYSSAQKIVSDAYDQAKNNLNGEKGGALEKLKQAASKSYSYLKDHGAGGVIKGMLQNKLGRPAMYAFNSLLTGDPVGVWHVTFGNPRNPIMSIGNLIITNTSVQQYGRLGIDDFPTGLKVTVTLKHAKSRDALELTQMYTKGRQSIYHSLNYKVAEKYFPLGTTYIPANSEGKTTDDTYRYQTVVEHPELDEKNALSIYAGTLDANQIIQGLALQ